MRLSVSSRAVSIRIGTAERADRSREIEAVLARHHDVEDEQIETQAVELGARLRGVVGGGDAIAFGGQKAREQVADAAVVVDDEQMRRVVGEDWQRASPCVVNPRPFARRALGARDHAQDTFAVFVVDHAGKKAARRLARARGRVRRARGRCALSAGRQA